MLIISHGSNAVVALLYVKSNDHFEDLNRRILPRTNSCTHCFYRVIWLPSHLQHFLVFFYFRGKQEMIFLIHFWYIMYIKMYRKCICDVSVLKLVKIYVSRTSFHQIVSCQCFIFIFLYLFLRNKPVFTTCLIAYIIKIINYRQYGWKM